MRDAFKCAVLFVFFAFASVFCWAKDTITETLGHQGYASWYGEGYRGKTMANNHPFNPDAMTAASWFFPLWTKVLVAHEGRDVIVTITDRGPRADRVKAGVVIDLSKAAFAAIADPKGRLTWVTIRKVN